MHVHMYMHMYMYMYVCTHTKPYGVIFVCANITQPYEQRGSVTGACYANMHRDSA